MRYMFLVTQTKGGQPPQALIDAMEDARKEALETGGMISTGGLGPAEQSARATLKGGKLTVKDGPFAESKEFLAGYWIIDVPSRDRAFEVAARASTAPGPDGKPLNMSIEVREVLSGLPTE